MYSHVTIPATEAVCQATIEHIVSHISLFNDVSPVHQAVQPKTMHDMLAGIGEIALNYNSVEVSITATDSPSGINPQDWFNLKVERLSPPEPSGQYSD